MKQFLKFLTKLKGFWKIYSGYGYDGETVEFIIENYTEVLENRTHTMSKPTYHAKDVISELDNYYNSIKKDGDKIFVNYNMCKKEYTLEQIETIVRAHEDMQDCKEHAGEHLHSEEYVKMFILRREVDRLKEINKEKDEVVEKLKKDSEEMKKRIGKANDRHQSDCIEKTQLHTALDVMTEKYQRLREIHGL